MAETITAARPYARAAFECAQEREGGLKQWSQMLQTMAAVAADRDMSVLLANPQIDDDVKIGLMLEACGDGVTQEGHNLMKLLAENQRLPALPDILSLFEEFRAEAEKTVHAQLISAFAVTDEQKDKITHALQAKLDREVVLECSVDESLIGGAVIRAGDLVIDDSARSQLAKLGAALRP